MKGPTWNQVNDANVEIRTFRVLGHRPEMGRSTVDVECPFCLGCITAYLWSIHGSGKRCTCGALLGGRGNAYHFSKESDR